jgi:hypothetical protein
MPFGKTFEVASPASFLVKSPIVFHQESVPANLQFIGGALDRIGRCLAAYGIERNPPV